MSTKVRHLAVIALAVFCIVLLGSCASKKDTAEESPAVYVPPFTLEGTSWTLTAIQVDSALIQAKDDRQYKFLEQYPEILFGPDGVFSAFTGVNRLAATYVLNTSIRSLQISQGALTRMMAATREAALMETLVVNLLQRVNSYSVAGAELTLYDAAGVPLMIFSRRT